MRLIGCLIGWLFGCPVPVSLWNISNGRLWQVTSHDADVSRSQDVAERHEADNDVWVWTVDDEEDMRLCTRLGVDAIISNRPAAVLDLLGRNR